MHLEVEIPLSASDKIIKLYSIDKAGMWYITHPDRNLQHHLEGNVIPAV